MDIDFLPLQPPVGCSSMRDFWPLLSTSCRSQAQNVGYRHLTCSDKFTYTTELSLPSSLSSVPECVLLLRLLASADTYPRTLPDFKWDMCGVGSHPFILCFPCSNKIFWRFWLHDWSSVTGAAQQIKCGHRSHRNFRRNHSHHPTPWGRMMQSSIPYRSHWSRIVNHLLPHHNNTNNMLTRSHSRMALHAPSADVTKVHHVHLNGYGERSRGSST